MKKQTKNLLRKYTQHSLQQTSTPLHPISIPQAIKKCSMEIMNIKPQNLKSLIASGVYPNKKTIKKSTAYLEKELPLRLARQIGLIDKLPLGFFFFFLTFCFLVMVFV